MDWSALNWVDWLFVAVLLYGAAMGAVRGLSHELAALIGMVAAVVVTRLFYEPLAAWACAQWGWNPEITRLGAVVALILLTLFGMRALRVGLGALMDFKFKGVVERVGGLLTGAVRHGAVFLVLLLAASFLPSSALQRAVMFESQTGQVVLPYLMVGYDALAKKVGLLQPDLPVGVAAPYAVMPPGAETPVPPAENPE